jgi:hypothetical protein
MKAGIFNDIGIEEYHAEKAWFSSTALRKAKKSLKLFKLYLNGYFDDEEKPQFDFGNAFELALLDPVEFDRKVAVETDILNSIYETKPDTKSPRSTTMYKEWFDEQKRLNKYVIPADGKGSFRTIEEMLKSCHADAVIQRLIKNIEYNYSICWIDDETGLQLKTRPDICKVKKNIIVDVKTTIDGSPEAFSKSLANYDYPFQAVMQIDGVLQSGFMEKVDNYFWLVIEKEPPFSATLYEFQKEDIEFCFDEYRYTLNLVAKAIKDEQFPSYSQRADNKYGILQAELPLWYRR